MPRLMNEKIQTTLIQFNQLKQLLSKNSRIRMNKQDLLFINKISNMPIIDIPRLQKKERELIDHLLEKARKQISRVYNASSRN